MYISLIVHREHETRKGGGIGFEITLRWQDDLIDRTKYKKTLRVRYISLGVHVLPQGMLGLQTNYPSEVPVHSNVSLLGKPYAEMPRASRIWGGFSVNGERISN